MNNWDRAGIALTLVGAPALWIIFDWRAALICALVGVVLGVTLGHRKETGE